ncbi:hypothetical protein D477_010381 [Arthrobacter crystallopoietes BAB-32]|uniref:Uncharacterized protein n=1 Tax=Arthrobacter crystallopoietes BAB-32 TaxID=1246476 RepID=N1V2N4_9MICC|nr:hypothetical protein [Arthrobacter crystallopoietes]EMY34302.1 hypothetical protein D477_010381 [Arthrobacter crystallopoietes BAB-32]
MTEESAGPARRTREHVKLKLLALAAALALCGMVPGPAATEAFWTDRENATASFTALVIPAPAITACEASSVLVSGKLVPKVVLTWQLPAGYQLEHVKYWYSDSGLLNLGLLTSGNGYTTTGPTAGTYTTTFDGGLLGGLLNGSAIVGLSVAGPHSWESDVASREATFPLVVGTNPC